MCSESGKSNSKIVTKSYIINENHTLPVMSISISTSDYNSILDNLNKRIEFLESVKNSYLTMDSKLNKKIDENAK